MGKWIMPAKSKRGKKEIWWESLKPQCISDKVLPAQQRLPSKSCPSEKSSLEQQWPSPVIKPYSIIGWGLSRKSMALAGELKRQFMKALKLEAFRWLQALQFNRKFLLEERSQKWFFRHCHKHANCYQQCILNEMDGLFVSKFIYLCGYILLL